MSVRNVPDCVLEYLIRGRPIIFLHVYRAIAVMVSEPLEASCQSMNQ